MQSTHSGKKPLKKVALTQLQVNQRPNFPSRKGFEWRKRKKRKRKKIALKTRTF